MPTKIQIVNGALSNIGLKAIAAFGQSSAESVVATNSYDMKVEHEIGSYRWRCFGRTQAIIKLTDAPPLPWVSAYQLPSELFQLWTVKVNGEPIDYDLRQQMIFTQDQGDETVVAEYCWRPEEPYWPPYFVGALTKRLEALFTRGVKRDEVEALRLDQMADYLFKLAQRTDAQQQGGRNPWGPSPLVSVRHG